MSPFLDAEQLAAHRSRNRLHSVLLVGGMSLMVLVAASLLWSPLAAVLATGLVIVLALAGPRLPPEAVMRLYSAVPVDGRHGAPLLRIVEVLADRAELDRHPRLYVIPSATLNAFATGTRDHAAIAVTEGLLRRLELREIAGVIAHEMSHIRNNDLSVMATADALARFTQITAYFGLFLGLVNIPVLLLGFEPFPWTAVAILYLTPLAASLIQLGLSRTREYDADAEAAGLTGDPEGLASALAALERYQGRLWEDVMLPVPARRIPFPSLLRSHPETGERIARLRQIARTPSRVRPVAFGSEPLFTLVGVGPAGMAPRYRSLGLWY